MLNVIIVLIFNCAFEVSSQCLTTLLVPGVADTSLSLLLPKYLIEKTKCADGTPRKAIIVNVSFGLTSTTSLWTQLKLHKDVIYPILQQHPEGVHIICYSQATVIIRALIQETDNHTIHNVISASGLHMGISGLPMIQRIITDLQKLTNSPLPYSEDFWKVCYNQLGQDTTSLCNLWRDEKKFDLYLKYNVFLPIINNEKPHSKSEKYKENLQTIKKLVLIVGSGDTIIVPWQSGLFGAISSDGSIINMEEQPIYTKDVLGLKALNDKGAIIKRIIPNANHWSSGFDENIFNEYILPYLD